MYSSGNSETSKSSITSFVWGWKYRCSLSRESCHLLLWLHRKNEMRISSNSVQNCKLHIFKAKDFRLNTDYLYDPLPQHICFQLSFFVFDFQNVNSVEVSVPVGNSDHTPYVVGLTTFVVSGGTIYLLVAIFRKDLRTPHAHQD